MSGDPWSAAIEEAYASAPAGVAIWPTLELHHPSFDTPARIVVDHGEEISGEPGVRGRRLRLEEDAPVNAGEIVTFVAAAVEATLPASEDGQAPEMSIAIDNVSGRLMPALNAAVASADPISVIYREYLADDPDTVHYRLEGMTLRRVTASMVRIEGKAGFLDMFNMSFPNASYAADEHPSLAS